MEITQKQKRGSTLLDFLFLYFGRNGLVQLYPKGNEHTLLNRIYAAGMYPYLLTCNMYKDTGIRG